MTNLLEIFQVVTSRIQGKLSVMFMDYQKTVNVFLNKIRVDDIGDIMLAWFKHGFVSGCFVTGSPTSTSADHNPSELATALPP